MTKVSEVIVQNEVDSIQEELNIKEVFSFEQLKSITRKADN